jgi:hypothetical protein
MRDRLSLLVRYLGRFNAGSDDNTLALFHFFPLLFCSLFRAIDCWPLSQDNFFCVSIPQLCCILILLFPCLAQYRCLPFLLFRSIPSFRASDAA